MPLLRRRFAVARLLFTAALLPARTPALPVASLTAPVANGDGACALAVVDGRPAIAWVDNGTRAVNYVRALDVAGGAWGTPVTLGFGPSLKFNVSLCVANGRPAVCCLGGTTLLFSCANDAAGASWPPAVTLGNDVRHSAMEVIDGNFAILLWNGNGLEYLRATSADAGTWSPRVQVTAAPCTGEFALTEIQGRPAAVFTGTATSSGLWYSRAADAAGAAWPQEKLVSQLDGARSISMQSALSHPAVTFHSSGGASSILMYTHGRDPDGTAWFPPVSLAAPRTMPSPLAAQSSLAVVNGMPAVSFLTRREPLTSMLEYRQAKDLAGDTFEAWNEALLLDEGANTGSRSSLAEILGTPAVAYIDISHSTLSYLRSGDAAGTLWPPGLQVHSASGPVPDGGSADFGPVAIGTSGTLRLTVINPRSPSDSLRITGLTFDGPDAAEFSVLTSPDTPVPAGGVAEIALRYAPLTAGIKTATLRILSNAASSGSPHDIILTGNTMPEMEVRLSGGRTLTVGSTVEIPWTPPGSPESVVFEVRNPGGAELNGLAVTITGPNRTHFAVTEQPEPALKPGGSTSFTVRHLALSAQSKTAPLRIATNLPGAGSVFIFNLSVARGALDEYFAPSFSGSTCEAVAVDPDGRIIAGGGGFIGVFNPDGTTDTSFFSPPLNGSVTCIGVQRDGRIVLGGSFQGGPTGSFGLKRIFPDGAHDLSFLPVTSNKVHCIAIQPDGAIVAGGDFENGTRRFLVRLHANGAVDETFNPGLDQWVLALAPLPDGKLLAGGFFGNGFPSVNRWGSRFNADGSGDPFPLQISDPVGGLAWRPDGSILVGQFFTSGLVRLLPDGTRAPGGPIVPAGALWSLAMQTDGECVGGTDVQLFRVGADGKIKSGTLAGQPNAAVLDLALQADGKILAGGSFSLVGPLNRTALARLTNAPAFTSLTREGAATLRWMRGGSSPEVSDVSFEMNTPGDSAWTLLGWGTRIPGGWELTGLNLPGTCQIRALGRAGGSLLQSTASFPESPLEAWRRQYFATANNTGDAADDADPDHDGLTNFTEFAFGLSPVDRTSNALPEFKYTNGAFTSTITAPEGRGDILYNAEWSATMQPGTWTAIPDTGTPPVHTFTATADQRIFVRYRVGVK